MANISKSSDDHIILVMNHQVTGKKLYFKMKRDVPLKKVLAEFCKRTNVFYRDVIFLLDGSRIQPNQTPNQLNMESQDEIDVMSSVFGGNYE